MKRFMTTMMISAVGLATQIANGALPQDPPTVIVRFADLDLSHSQGVTLLYQRLKRAAETVCAPQNGRDLERQTRYEKCWQTSLGAAVAKVDRAALTAFYRAKFGGNNATIQVAQK
jgi:UrcA family protein